MYHFTLCLNRTSLVHLDSSLGSFVDYGVPGTGRQLQIELATLTVIQSHIQWHIFAAKWNKDMFSSVSSNGSQVAEREVILR